MRSAALLGRHTHRTAAGVEVHVCAGGKPSCVGVPPRPPRLLPPPLEVAADVAGLEVGAVGRRRLPRQPRHAPGTRASVNHPAGGGGRAALELEWLADEPAVRACRLHAGSPLVALGFPERVESDPAGFPVARHASLASHPLLPVRSAGTFMADLNTFAGDSGGPVFLADPRPRPSAEGKAGEANPAGEGEAASHASRHADGPAAGPDDAPPLVLGMIVGQFRHDERTVTETEERTTHYPLNLATVLHARFAREAIERLKK